MSVIVRIIKICCTALFVYIIFSKVHYRSILPYLHHINYFYLCLALLTMLLEAVLAGYRWSRVMESLKLACGAKFYINVYLVSVMFNQVLPTSIGGDGYRMLETYRACKEKTKAAGGVLSDRILGSTGLLLLTIFCLPFAYSILTFQQFSLAVLITLCGLIAVIIMYFFKKFDNYLINRYFSWLKTLSNTLHQSCDNKFDLLLKLAISVITNACAAITAFFISLSLGMPIALIKFLIIMPYVCLFMMVPISIAGWGLREGVMITLGTTIGMATAGALTVSILYGIVSVVAGFPGLVIFLFSQQSTIKKVSIRP